MGSILINSIYHGNDPTVRERNEIWRQTNCKVKYGNKYFSKHKCMVDQPEPVLLSNQTNEDTEF